MNKMDRINLTTLCRAVLDFNRSMHSIFDCEHDFRLLFDGQSILPPKEVSKINKTTSAKAVSDSIKYLWGSSWKAGFLEQNPSFARNTVTSQSMIFKNKSEVTYFITDTVWHCIICMIDDVLCWIVRMEIAHFRTRFVESLWKDQVEHSTKYCHNPVHNVRKVNEYLPLQQG